MSKPPQRFGAGIRYLPPAWSGSQMPRSGCGDAALGTDVGQLLVALSGPEADR